MDLDNYPAAPVRDFITDVGRDDKGSSATADDRVHLHDLASGLDGYVHRIAHSECDRVGLPGCAGRLLVNGELLTATQGRRNGHFWNRGRQFDVEKEIFRPAIIPKQSMNAYWPLRLGARGPKNS